VEEFRVLQQNRIPGCSPHRPETHRAKLRRELCEGMSLGFPVCRSELNLHSAEEIGPPKCYSAAWDGPSRASEAHPIAVGGRYLGVPLHD